MSTPATSPLAGPIAPPSLSVPASPASPPPAVAAPAPAPAPTAEPGSVFGALINASTEADDATLSYALGDLGLGAALGFDDGGVVTPAPAASAPPAPAAETAQQKRDRLKAELAEVEKVLAPEGTAPPEGAAPAAQPPASPDSSTALPALPVITPTAEAPLVNLSTAEQLTAAEAAARAARDWSFAHRDGGELPLELAQQIENLEATRMGRAPRQLTQAPEIEADGVARIFTAAQQMLEQHVPARRTAIEGERQAMATLRRDSPQYLDPQTEEGKLFPAAAQELAALRGHPHYLLLVRDLVRGFLANRPAATVSPAPAPTVPAPTPAPTPKNIIPIAPAPPVGGAPASAPRLSQGQIEAAMTRLNAGTASDEDLITLSHAAV